MVAQRNNLTLRGNEMSDQSRRKLLKSIAAGSGAIVAGKNLPEKWTRPVVDSVMLPAHAQTSESAPSTGPFAGSNDISITMKNYDSHFAKVADSLVNTAHAAPETRTLSYCITVNDDNTANVTVLYTQTIVGEPCPYGANQFNFTNVPLNTDIAVAPVTGCPQGAANKWIDNIGLINDANAVIDMGTINLTSFTGNASGTFTYQSIIDSFTFGAGLCGPTLADCCQDF
jgi:hypothetical protein